MPMTFIIVDVHDYPKITKYNVVTYINQFDNYPCICNHSRYGGSYVNNNPQGRHVAVELQ